MKAKLLFTVIIMTCLLSACTVDELETNLNEINFETIVISEHKYFEKTQDTVVDRTGTHKPPND